MNIEELNKSQIVLLTLLVSFVTSIATAVMTAALMDQGVKPVTNTINQIVERTKEVVVKVPEKTKPKIITKETKVLVKETELVANAVNIARDKVVMIYAKNKEDDNKNISENTQPDEDKGINTEDQTGSVTVATGNGNKDANNTEKESGVTDVDTYKFIGRGVILDGKIVTDNSVVVDGDEYKIVFSDETFKILKVVKKDRYAEFIVKNIVGINMADLDRVGLGKTVVILSGNDRLKVTSTIISDVLKKDDSVESIEVGGSGYVTTGSIVVNLSGEFLGISTDGSRKLGNRWFNTIK